MPNLSFAIMGKPPAYRYHLLRNALDATKDIKDPQIDTTPRPKF